VLSLLVSVLQMYNITISSSAKPNQIVDVEYYRVNWPIIKLKNKNFHKKFQKHIICVNRLVSYDILIFKLVMAL